MRGRTGGYRLALPPAQVRLGGVLLALGEPLFDDPGYCIEYGKRVYNFADQDGPEAFGNVSLAKPHDFDGSWHFCRAWFRSDPRGDGGNWSVDYPRADINLSVRLSELTKTTVSFTNGVGTAVMTLYDVQSTTLTATSGSLSGTSATFSVSPAAAASYTVSAPGSATAFK